MTASPLAPLRADAQFFSLPDLQLDASKRSLPPLASVQQRYVLPELDERGAGVDRMLRRLDEAMWWDGPGSGGRSTSPTPVLGAFKHDAEDSMSGQGKGKGRAEPLLREHDEVQEETQELWEAAGLYASREPTFKPLGGWDALRGGSSAPDAPGPSTATVFHAVTTLANAPISLPKLRPQPPSHISPSDLLRVLLRSTLGTTVTSAIDWDARHSRFTWRDDGLAVDTLSRRAARSSANEFLDIGTAVRRIEMRLADQSTRLLTPTHHALFHTVSTYLVFVKTRLTEVETLDVDGWHGWSGMLKEVRELLGVLCEVIGWPLNQSSPASLPSRASSLLSYLHAHLLAHYTPSDAPSASLLALAYIMQHAARPFLELLHAWIGLSADIGDAHGADAQPWADLGITRRVKAGVAAGAPGYTYEFSSKRMPAFIPRDLRRKLFEGGKSLRLLRDARPEHPSCGCWEMEAGWDWDGDRDVFGEVQTHIASVRRGTATWRRSVQSGMATAPSFRLRAPRKARKGILDVFQERSPAGPENEDPSEGVVRMLARLGSAPDPRVTGIWSASPTDELATFLATHSHRPLLPSDTPTFPLFISDRLLASALAHAELVNRALVSLFLVEMHYTAHLDVLSAFWLGGDAAFSERVSAALFGREDEGVALGLGRRARTRARMGLAPGAEADASGAPEGDWGVALGVGLSDRARWPPGGSELACALRTTLVDVDDGAGRGAFEGEDGEGEVWRRIEDSVSFAIKPLPEDERGRKAKWLDPQAVEALDFLYLAYTPPPELGSILPRDVLEKYQRIHAFLLRLSRTEVALRGMYRDLTARDVDETGMDAERLAYFARARGLRARMAHFVGATVRYAMDTAIEANHLRMRTRLGRLRLGSVRAEREGLVPDEASDVVASPSSLDGPADDLSLVHDGDLDGGLGRPGYDDEDNDDDGAPPIFALSSAQSLVAYHHLTLDRIMRACLLSGGAAHALTAKLLMRLLGLALDGAKAVRCVARGWDDGRGDERVREVAREWREKERVFMHALERLAMRTRRSGVAELGVGVGADQDAGADAEREEGQPSSGATKSQVEEDADADAERARDLVELDDDADDSSRRGNEALKEWLLRLDVRRGAE